MLIKMTNTLKTYTFGKVENFLPAKERESVFCCWHWKCTVNVPSHPPNSSYILNITVRFETTLKQLLFQWQQCGDTFSLMNLSFWSTVSALVSHTMYMLTCVLPYGISVCTGSFSMHLLFLLHKQGWCYCRIYLGPLYLCYMIWF